MLLIDMEYIFVAEVSKVMNRKKITTSILEIITMNTL